MILHAHTAARVAAVFGHALLGDPRRTRRLVQTVELLARQPSASVPAACVTDAAVQATYRLMNNRHVTFDSLLAPQVDQTRQRAETARDVLVLHDTSDCSFSDLDPRELGYLNTGKAGFRFHAALVVDANEWRRPLGVIAAETVHRRRPSRRRKAKASGSDSANQVDKEFGRWHRVLEASGERLACCRNVVHVADRESDSYALMHDAISRGQRFVFRVRVDRRGREVGEEGAEWSRIKEIAHGATGLLEREVELSRRVGSTAPRAQLTHPPRKARIATLRFAATTVEIPRPQYLRAPFPRTMELNLVHVVEIRAPAGEPAVEWLLYTTEPVTTPDDVARVVDIYRTRWLSEEFHAAIKGGCAFETREFVSRHALLNMLAVSLPIACEILAVRSLARTASNRPASDILTPLQLLVLRTLGHRHLPPDATIEQALFAIAGLGGHMKRNGPPGWRVLSRGMVSLQTSVIAWAAGAAAAA